MSVKDTLKKKVAPVMAAAALLTPVATQASEQNAPAPKDQTIEQKIEQGVEAPAVLRFAPEMAKKAQKLAEKADAFNRCGLSEDSQAIVVYYRDDGYIQITGDSEQTQNNYVILDKDGREVKDVEPLKNPNGINIALMNNGDYGVAVKTEYDEFDVSVAGGNLKRGNDGVYKDARKINKKQTLDDQVDRRYLAILARFEPVLKEVSPEMAKQASKWADKYDVFKRCGGPLVEAKTVDVMFRNDGYIQITGDRGRYEYEENGRKINNCVVLDMNGNEVKDVAPVASAEGVQVSLNKDGNYSVDNVVNLGGYSFHKPISKGKVETKDYAKTIENIGQKAEDIAKLVHNGVLGR